MISLSDRVSNQREQHSTPHNTLAERLFDTIDDSGTPNNTDSHLASERSSGSCEYESGRSIKSTPTRRVSFKSNYSSVISPKIDYVAIDQVPDEEEKINQPNASVTLDARSLDDGTTILAAVRDKIPARELIQLISTYPNACQTRDRDGNLPIHLASTYVASVEVLQSLLRYYPGSISCVNSHRQLPLHRACALNRAVKVALLLITSYADGLTMADDDGNLPVHYAAAFNNVFILKLCLKRQKYLYTTATRNNEGFLPLHLAALHNSTSDNCRVLIKCYSYGLNVRTVYNDLPVHLAMYYNTNEEVVRFIAMQSPDGLLSSHSIHELLDSRLARRQANYGNYWMEEGHQHRHHHNGNRHIHICGQSLSGKSVLAYWLCDNLNLSSARMPHDVRRWFLPCFDQKERIHLPLNRRTDGVQIKKINHVDRKHYQKTDYTVYDYSGKAEYMVNHSNYLAINDSIFLIVVPLFDVANQIAFSFEELLDQFLMWLRIIYSVNGSYDQMGHVEVGSGAKKQHEHDLVASRSRKNIFSGASMRKHDELEGSDPPKVAAASYDARLRTVYENDNTTADNLLSKEVVYVPIVLVLNSFSMDSREAASNSELQSLAARLIVAAKKIFPCDDSSRARFLSTLVSENELISDAYQASGTTGDENSQADAALDAEHRSLMARLNVPLYDRRLHFVDPVICNAEERDCLQALLPAINNSGNYIFSKFSTGLKNVCIHIEKSLEKNPLPIMMKMSHFVDNMRLRLDKYAMVESLHKLEDRIFKVVRDVLSDSVISFFHRSGRIKVVNSSRLSSFGRKFTEDVVITDPFFVSNSICNSIIGKLMGQHAMSDEKSYMFKKVEIDNFKGTITSRGMRISSSNLKEDFTYNVDGDNSLLDELSASQLLEVVGFIVPVQYDSERNMMLCPGQARSDSRGQNEEVTDTITLSQHFGDNDNYLLFGLISEKAPARFVDLFLSKHHTTILSSYFVVREDCYSFVPGFFMKLFYSLIQADNYRNDFVKFYSDAVVIETHRRQLKVVHSSNSPNDGFSITSSDRDNRLSPLPGQEGEFVIVYKKQLLICPVVHNSLPGFQVIVGISPGEITLSSLMLSLAASQGSASPASRSALFDGVQHVDLQLVFSENKPGSSNVTQFTSYFDDRMHKYDSADYIQSANGKYHRSLVERDASKIRRFLGNQVWNIELDEVPLQCTRSGEEQFHTLKRTIDEELSNANFAIDI